MTGSGAIGSSGQGFSLSLSGDGNTAIIGGDGDNGGLGAAWIFTRSNSVWAQQAKLLPTGADASLSDPLFGFSAAISTDGNTAVVGAPYDADYKGAIWIFTRANGSWSQQGSKLFGTGAATSQPAQGSSVAISADGNTVISGSYTDESAWIFQRVNGVWAQQGARLRSPSGVEPSSFGSAVAISGDGSTVTISSRGDNGGAGAVWIFGLVNGAWTQQGPMLTVSDPSSVQINSVALATDGNTLVVGNVAPVGDSASAWVFVRSVGAQGPVWSQQGSRLIGSGTVSPNNQPGTIVSLSGDGNTALLGYPGDNQARGAAWIFTRSAGVWSQLGGKLLPAGVVISSGLQTGAGIAVALSRDGATAMVGAPGDAFGLGAAYVYTPTVTTHFSLSVPSSATATAPFSFSVTALDASQNPDRNYFGAVHFTSTDSAAVLPSDTILANGAATVTAALSTSGNRTITATDVDAPITGTSGAIAVSSGLHLRVTVPASVTAGAGFTFTVTAQDANNATVTNYSGTVHFSSSDLGATLPGNATLTNGVGTFVATLVRSGNQTLSANDTVSASTSGISAAISVGSGPAAHITIVAPATTSAGVGANFVVTLLDSFGNVASFQGHSFSIATTDPAALIFNASAISVLFKTAGTQYVVFQDQINPALGATYSITVIPAATSSLQLSANFATVTAGTPFSFTVTARDVYGNLTPSYTGPVQFTSSDSSAVLPGSASLVQGSATFTATLITPGSQTITAADTVSPTTGGTAMITVTPGPVTHFVLSTPATATANAGFTFSVFADDAKGVASNYTGTVHFTSSDPAAILPGDTTPGRAHSFAAVLSTPGPQTITVTDTAVPSLTLTSNPITVGSGAHFAVSVPATATAGKPFQFTVTALDASNNVMTGYSGTVHFSSSQFLPTVPADTTLTNGTGTFTATLTTAGYQTIRASDTMSSTPQAGVSETLVSAGPPVSWSMTAPGTAIAGAPFTITVGVIDAYSNAISSYVGNIHFTSSDPQAVLPADSAIHGSNTFQVKLNTAGSFTVLTNDPSGQILQGGASITVSAASAARLIVTAPTTVAAGTTFHVTVTAQDAFGNPTPAYTPLIHFAGSDPAASLPADYVLAPNAQTYSAILNTPGTQTITVTDKSGGAASGTSAPISVGSGSTLHLSVSAPSTALTGTPIVFTVAALNSDNSVATTYNGTVQFSSTASSVTLPANAALVNGSGTFQATFNSLGTQTITAKDIIVPSITGTSASITVSPPPPAQFSIGAPAVATVGVPLTLNIYATTANRGVATGYNGTVRFSSTDPSASLPSNLQLTNGQASFPVTFNTSGNQTVTATDTANSSLTGTTNPISVAALPATHFSLTTPTSALAGAGVLLTITALDANNHQTPAYFGPVHFSSSDPAASLPNDTTLFSGTGFVIVVLKTVGTQTITVSDTISGFSTTTGAITVTKAPATHFGLTLPSSITAGVQFSFTVVALDVANNTATSYGGTVHFSSSDSAAILPANTALTNGTGAFQATMNTAGIFSITVTDTASAITGTASVGVNSGTATHFQVSAPSTATAGTSIQYTVTALDAANNRADHYTGTVRYTSTDAAAVFIQSLQLNSGFGSFPVTLKTAGTQSISVADTANPSTTGNSGPISVVAAPASHFTVSAPSAATAGIAFQVTVTALDPYGNVDTHYTGTVHFTSTDALTALPTNTSVGGGSAVFSVTLNSSGGQKITVSDINTSSINGTSGTVAVSSATGAPSAIGVATGGTGAGYNTTITATFADTAGYLNLHVIDVLINNVLDGRQACYIAFVPSGVNSGSLFLVDDAGDSGGPYAGTTLPGSGIVQNSQCTVSGAASGAGTLLTLTLNVTFNTAFGGDKIVYASAGDQSGANTNWQALGTWSVPGLSVPALSVTGMSPVRSSGFGPTVYTFTFNDAGSFADPNSVENILINTAIDGRHACYLAFQPATSSLFLVDDAGDSAGPFQGMVLPSSNSIGNSQCTIAGAASSVRLNGTTLTLTLSITFSQNLAGNQIFYLAARNSTSNSDWQAAGSAGVR